MILRWPGTTNQKAGSSNLSGHISLKLAALRFIGHQHYILHGRDRIIRSFHHPDTSPSLPFEVHFFGMRYPGNLNDFIDWSVFMYGAYSRNELYLLRDVAAILRKENAAPLSFYDIGANVGQHSLFMAQHADHVFSFEPFAAVRNKLLEKVTRNKLKNVTVYPVALGDVGAELDFFEPSGANNGSGSFVAGESSGERVVQKLPVRKGDDFLQGGCLPKMDIIKMDVEGFEIRVLSGLHDRLRRDRPVILMEISAKTRADVVTEAGFRQHLYEDAKIFELSSVSISSSYRLRRFCFESSGEILIVPKEKVSILQLTE
jgi:FkbM family methyltransferase